MHMDGAIMVHLDGKSLCIWKGNHGAFRWEIMVHFDGKSLCIWKGNHGAFGREIMVHLDGKSWLTNVSLKGLVTMANYGSS